jgi:EmrB/QacA subfamily drug resistance transporter
MAHRTLAMTVLIIANFIDLMDTTVVNVALPAIQNDLHATPADLEWVVGAYTLALAATLITGGRLGDIIGTRRTFVLGIAGFTLASLVAALAGSADVLVVARAVQGAFAGLMVPQVLAGVQSMYAPAERAPIYGLVGFITGTASVVGPIVGGWLVSSNAFGIGWRAIFMVNVPVGVALGIAAMLVVPNSRSAHSRRLDLPGVLLVTGGVLCLVFPLVEGRQAGWPLWAWLVLAAAPLFLAAFAVWQRRSTSPVVSLRLFRDRGYLAGSVVNLTFQAGLVGFFFLLSLYLQQALRYPALEAGLTWVGFSLGALAGSALSVPLVRRFGRRPMTAGALLTAGAVVWISLLAVAPGAGPVPTGWYFTPALVLGGFGMGLLIVPLYDAALETVPVAEAGSASGALSTVQQIGGSLGIAVMGAIFYTAATATPTEATITTGLRAASWGSAVAFTLAAVASLFLASRPVRTDVPDQAHQQERSFSPSHR